MTEVDEPVTIDGWSPRNSNGRFIGAVSVRDAFALSINTVAVKLAERAGFDTVAAVARRMGIAETLDTRPAMALGSNDVTLIEMVSAYAAVANQGNEAKPYAILKVATSGGEVLWTREPPEPRQLVGPDIAAKMTGLLKAAVETGTGRQAQMGRELAGKTGTTSSNKDGWFIGFTSDLVAGVWMGRDDARALPGLAGGRAPARAFAAFMGRASRGAPGGLLQTQVPVDAAPSEPDAETYGLSPPDAVGGEPPIAPDRPPPQDGTPDASLDSPDGDATRPPAEAQANPRLDQAWLDGVLRARERRAQTLPPRTP